ncbi:hypothetical protein L1276_002011 [Flavobacterium sp. HSC-32F16]|nr:hypothetical protein [Flavobacterium sp. HSC-32F16]
MHNIFENYYDFEDCVVFDDFHWDIKIKNHSFYLIVSNFAMFEGLLLIIFL